MYVRDFMHTDVVTVTPDTPLPDAEQMMREKNIRRLPVVDHGKLVGIVTKTALREVAPSQATSLSIWELHYVLAKMKVSDAMTRNLITVTPDTLLEDAALIGYKHGVGALPVVEDGRMVGIITETDTFRVLLELLGTSETGVRLRIPQDDESKKRMIGEIAAAINRIDCPIQSIFRVHSPSRSHPDIVVRLAATNAEEAVQELKKLGYKVEVT